MLEVQLLGTFEIRLDGEPVDIPSRPAQSLLAYLILNAHLSHRRENLAGMLWPDSDETNARNNLRQALWRLRKSVGEAFFLSDKVSVSFNPQSAYRLDADLLQTDLADTSSIEVLMQAVAVYEGKLLAGFYDEWVLLEQERLQAIYEERMQLLLAKLVEAGQWHEIREWAERWIAQGLTPEPAYRALMMAHAGLGDLASVATVFQRCNQALVEALGVEPSQETQQLFQQLTSGEVVPDRQVQVKETTPQPPVNLPRQATPFIGREDELAQLAALLADPATRLVTILGPGGMGKTRLAIEAAQAQRAAFADGIYFVSLAPVQAADFTDSINPLVAAIANSLQIKLHSDTLPEAQLLAYLSRKEMLLVLDNFEHLVETVGFLSDLLAHAFNLKLLITSRERLNLQEEWLFPLQGLPYPEPAVLGPQIDPLTFGAIQLFTQRARQIKPDFGLEAELPALLHICRLVEGMPLGLELAATWVRQMTCATIAKEVETEIDFLATRLRNVPDRHRSIRAVFTHSWQKLSEEEQIVLQKLSVFRGGFERDAAQAVAQASLSLLSDLVDKSLLALGENGRYITHELLRHYAAEKLSQTAASETAVLDHHSDYYCILLQRHTANWHNAWQSDAFSEVTREADNIRRAWHWALQQEAWQRLHEAIDSWCWYYSWRGFYAEAEQLCQTICNNVEHWVSNRKKNLSAGYYLWAKAMIWSGYFAKDLKVANRRFQRSLSLLDQPTFLNENSRMIEAFALLCWGDRISDLNRQQARSYLEQSLTLYEALQDQWGVAKVLGLLSYLDWSTGDYLLAQKRAQASLDIQQALGNRREQIHSLTYLAWVSQHLGQMVKAEQLRHQALDLCQRLGDRSTLPLCTTNLAYTVIFHGRFDEGREWAEKSLVLDLEDGYLVRRGYNYLAVGFSLLFNGQYKEAQQMLTRTLEAVREVNQVSVEASVHCSLGYLALVEKEYDKAQAAFEEGFRLYQTVQGDAYTFLALSGLGLSTYYRGHLDQSHLHFIQLLTEGLRRKDYLYLLTGLPGLALYLAKTGKVEQAITAWAQAQCQSFVANSPLYEVLVGRHITVAAEKLPTEVVETAQTRGRARDLQETARELLAALKESKVAGISS